MPVTVANLPTIYLDRIRKFVEAGTYSDVSSFILAAVETQLALEANHHTAVATQPKTSPPPATAREASPTPGLGSWPATPKTVDAPGAERFWAPLLWGQYNRIFPGVVALRVLGRLVIDRQSAWIPLSEFRDAAAAAAVAIGVRLDQLDAQLGSVRGQKLATALPVGGRDDEKSRLRYQNQFVGTLSRTGDQIGGLPAALLMANIRAGEDGGAIVGITAAGAEFAGQPWPALEGATVRTTFDASHAVSYVRHVARSLPLEFDAMKEVLTGIADGRATPTAVDEVVGAFLRARNLKEELASTQRTGLIGRMNELGLIEFQRDGSAITYHVAARGRDLVLDKSPRHYE